MLDLVSRDDMLRFMKKNLRMQFCVFIFAVAFLLFTGQSLLLDGTKLSYFSFGLWTINTLMTLVYVLEQYSEYKLEKHRCQLINEMKDREYFVQTMEMAKRSKENYEALIKKLHERQENVRPE